MASEGSKRRDLLALSFITTSISKKSPTKILFMARKKNRFPVAMATKIPWKQLLHNLLIVVFLRRIVRYKW